MVFDQFWYMARIFLASAVVGRSPASSESEIAFARANSACLCALQPYNYNVMYVENNPRPRSSRGSRIGAIEISKNSKNPRFSSFRLPTAPTVPSDSDPADLASNLGIWPPASGFRQCSIKKYRIGTRSARKASRGVPNSIALAQEPYAGRRAGPGDPQSQIQAVIL